MNTQADTKEEFLKLKTKVMASGGEDLSLQAQELWEQAELTINQDV